MPQDDHERLELDQRQPSAAPEPRRDVSVPFVLLATVAFFVARIPLISRRVFDPDEFEHSHAAWSVFKGLLPYQDFFEHHTPWYYFALSPFFRWFAVDQSFESARRFLIFARVLFARAGRAVGRSRHSRRHRASVHGSSSQARLRPGEEWVF